MSIYTTELSHHKTQNLSKIFAQDIKFGMQLLLSIEDDLLTPFAKFESALKPILLARCRSARGNNSKIILVGSGSSGRIAKIIEHLYKDVIVGYIAGGDISIIKPQEGFEDSEIEGEVFAKSVCKFGDLLFLISASGSARFNYGAAKAANDLNIAVYYFYNNENEPEILQELIDYKIVIPLKYVSGSQAITGSTRLQSANLALLCFSSLFDDLILGEYRDNSKLLEQDLSHIKNSIFSEAKFLDFYKKIEDTFLAESSIFYSGANIGFLTYITDSSLFPVVFSDITELSPTFGESVCRKVSDKDSPDASIRAYLCEEDKNFSIPEYELVIDDYEKQNRPGEFVEIRINDDNLIFQNLEDSFYIPAFNTAFCSTKHTEKGCKTYSFFDIYNLKLILNLISNSLMIRGGKVFGNIMIYVKPSNIKLKYRVFKTLSDLLIQENKEDLIPQIQDILDEIYQNSGSTNSVISPIPIAFLMLTKGYNLEEAREYLIKNKWRF